jgi:hypothetical protein
MLFFSQHCIGQIKIKKLKHLLLLADVTRNSLYLQGNTSLKWISLSRQYQNLTLISTDEKTCYSFLESQRWNGQPVCLIAGTTKKPYNVKPRGKFKEYFQVIVVLKRNVILPFTVRTGSIFEG